jgi:hypothetical protein
MSEDKQRDLALKVTEEGEEEEEEVEVEVEIENESDASVDVNNVQDNQQGEHGHEEEPNLVNDDDRNQNEDEETQNKIDEHLNETSENSNMYQANALQSREKTSVNKNHLELFRKLETVKEIK